MYKAQVINDIEICPRFDPNLGCSHIFIFKKEKKAKIVFKTARLAYKEEYLSVQKELSDRINEVAQKGYAYCDEAVFTHGCRIGYDLEEQGQHMAIRFKKVDYIPEYRVYLGPIICVDDNELAAKEADVKKTKLKIGCRSKYPSNEQYINFYNDAYNDDVVKAANKIYRLDEFSPDRKISGFPFYGAQCESESNRMYRTEIENQIEEDFQLLAKDGFKFQQLITIPVNGKERPALLFSKTGTKILSFSGESVFLDGFELWYKPLVRGRLRRLLERIFPDYFEKKDQMNEVYINTEIEDTERLEAVYTNAFNDQSFDALAADQVQVPITIISKTRVPHFGEDVEHLFLLKDLVLRGVITTGVFRKITKQMISKAGAAGKASNENDSDKGNDNNSDLKNEAKYKASRRALKKEYRRNMRILSKPHVDVFTSSIAATIIDVADNNPRMRNASVVSTSTEETHNHSLGVESRISESNETDVNSKKHINTQFDDSAEVHYESKNGDSLSESKTGTPDDVPSSSSISSPARKTKKSVVKYAILGLVVMGIVALLCGLFAKSYNRDGDVLMESDTYVDADISDDSEFNTAVEDDSQVESEDTEQQYDEEEVEPIVDQQPEYNILYTGKIGDAGITMSLVMGEETVRGFYNNGAAKINLSGTIDGSTITMIGKTEAGEAVCKFIGTLDGKSLYGTFTDMTSGEESSFSLDQDGPSE